MSLEFMKPEEALRHILLSDDGVSALVAERVYPSQAKYDDTYPLVLYALIESEYFEKIDGLARNNLAHVNIQLDIYGTDYNAAKAAATAVREALSAYTGLVATVTQTINIRRIRIVDERDGFVPPAGGSTDGACSVIQEYDVWFFNE